MECVTTHGADVTPEASLDAFVADARCKAFQGAHFIGCHVWTVCVVVGICVDDIFDETPSARFADQSQGVFEAFQLLVSFGHDCGGEFECFLNGVSESVLKFVPKRLGSQLGWNGQRRRWGKRRLLDAWLNARNFVAVCFRKLY